MSARNSKKIQSQAMLYLTKRGSLNINMCMVQMAPRKGDRFKEKEKKYMQQF